MSDPNMIMNFANNQPRLLTGIGQGLAGLGGKIVNQIQGRRANEAYTEALGSYTEDGSEENLLALYEAAGPVGKFDQIKTTIADMDSLTQKNQLQQNMEYYSGVISGNSAMTIDKLEADALANENDGDVAEAKQLRHLAQQLREGKDKEFLSFIGGMSGMLEGGSEAMGNIRDQNADTIAEGNYWLGVMETGANLNKSQTELDAMQAAYDADPTLAPVIEQSLNFATAVEGGYSPEAMEATKLLQGIDEKFFKRKGDYNKAVISNQGFQDTYARVLEAVANPNTTVFQQGAADLKLFNIWMRQIDDATVRENDVVNIKALNALRDQIGLVAEKLGKGAMLSPTQRSSMAEMSRDTLAAQKNFVDKEVFPGLYAGYKAIDNSPEDKRYAEAFGDWENPMNAEGNPVIPEETPIESVSNVVPQSGDARLNALRAHVGKSNPQSNANFDSMSEEQLNKYNASKTFVYTEDTPEDETIVEVNY